MTAATELAPLVKELTVAVPVERAWTVFTQEIGSWWPVATHSIAPEQVREIVFEARAGGRIVERWKDGTEQSWGEVAVCEPPHRLLFSWHPNLRRRAATEVEVTFEPVDGGTRLRLEHRGWERLGAEGAESRSDYDGGWDYVLGRYAGGI
ncbi:MAG: SRPBCC family protein [Actinomycetota bacterium]|nr:SRPBCC family protein [Actinomycetota bacterium]